LGRETCAPSLKPISRTPSVKSAAYNRGLGSAASSRVPSPIITAMSDVTPLPSPLLSGDSPGPWKRLQGRPPSRDAPPHLPTIMSDSVLVTSNGESISSLVANQSKRRSLIPSNGTPADSNSNNNSTTTTNADNEGSKPKIHTRNRSTSEYRPDHPNFPKRMSTVSGPRPGHQHQPSLRREPHLSESRGLTPIEKPPSPPPSESSVTAGDSTSSLVKPRPNYEYFDARGRKDGKLRRWRAVKSLGQGTFSRVVLGTSHVSASEDEIEAEHSAVDSGLLSSKSTSSLDRKALVAVKVCEHGPKGGASEERVEMSLKRELEIMQSIHHPSLVDLKAWSIEPTRAILVLSYCPGGDLFDVATAHSNLLSPPLIRRIFAELVGAVQYLHECHIVHRDIKLENVLVNLTPQELADSSIDWQSYPYSVTTLTDLGLSRRVADDEKLTTRCGSEDYAAPELIMGLEYSGFATDAWSVGVLLYALLESRLPFDPPPGISDALRMRSRTSHRIARVEWQWIKYAGDDGDHEGNIQKFESAGLLGAMQVTEALLKRASRRWSLHKVAEVDWVKGGIAVEGGLKFAEAEEGE
ncbi:kinase-like domain-containing protein, partial [Coniella lustricola]